MLLALSCDLLWIWCVRVFYCKFVRVINVGRLMPRSATVGLTTYSHVLAIHTYLDEVVLNVAYFCLHGYQQIFAETCA